MNLHPEELLKNRYGYQQRINAKAHLIIWDTTNQKGGPQAAKGSNRLQALGVNRACRPPAG
ncbi:hypothetical protein [Halomonas sp. C05BenzN]|uniref:hypothetical protein n=1 Tax=Halomonas sp. C05BenzN TaxID=3411041 RepID=UPI003B966195